ncbi:unnamed protein product [Didymodactylos carnosus]|uniref:EF-hand domain-containing protein n=1 Tax=Didymodactylos carnosus TaxID=1234261 RepID=A0A815QMD3_9BILA|nr:unnamed protein product [Didymodactylos carnosus]CAF1465316.1 unnamed protein product [Didymodactylos carnosus]CAF3710767.1 unnamed protein product [Didymodactylos carnosus]CAF4334631.1 unnamed protein product [Didymodactylos carnosus]
MAKPSRFISHSDVSRLTIKEPRERDDDSKSFSPSTISRTSSVLMSTSSSINDRNPEIIDQIRDAFTIFDKEFTGSITTEQFSKVLEGLGYTVPEAELVLWIQQLDTDQSGKYQQDIPLHTVVSAGLPHLLADLRSIITNLGEKVTAEDLDEMIREADIDKDYKVSFDEFQRIMSFK